MIAVNPPTPPPSFPLFSTKNGLKMKGNFIKHIMII